MWFMNIFRSSTGVQSEQQAGPTQIISASFASQGLTTSGESKERSRSKSSSLPDLLVLSENMPESVSDLQILRPLGGSTGAFLAYDPSTKRKYVKKMGVSPTHIINEYHVLALYAACGARVPEAKLYQTNDGPCLLTIFIPGKTLTESIAHLTGGIAAPEVAHLVSDLRRFFVADALLGSWDVLGRNYDNIIVDDKGLCWRIDFGCGLSFRAQGAVKSSVMWSNEVLELETMRDRALNFSCWSVYKNVSKTAINNQILDLKGRKSTLLYLAPESEKSTLIKRLDFLERYASCGSDRTT
jgi:hypothetical protein